MASAYKIIELVGVSKKSWEDAATAAIATAGKSLTVTKMDMQIKKGKVVSYRTRLSVSFKYKNK